ncbi:hypothetical protein HMEPL2_28200 [Vreelandella aquamarina]|uniref:Uncharacterized protein n=1 Tax=Vreelandella aquamarina TaxID=77097 RepID=A0A6F8XEZ6_9GAMM|nr:hypothetical protein HMEPL2_28200 [Halomonas meridiana]
MNTPELSIWTIYRHPQDHPRSYVARRWVTKASTPEPIATQDAVVADDLEGALCVNVVVT